MNGFGSSGPCSTLKKMRIEGLKHVNMPVIYSNKTGQSGILAGRRPKVPYYYCRLRAVPPITPSITLAKWA
ncbi:hypothetical protein FOTG_19179 [Fusarium oxysporum f. sp. vasinfectum 25433]|uniref:Uncharacterized protein n=1 Tax=Fusarium oxysporum f. sp. vasinfectum 25433 TaxID=1089449 RepID=X0LUZ3_FUSOX|nr:hypothetical protein FOTG_19179 [Fusarium oxysporum f. sp. vasinfectum 25433]